MSDPDEWDDDGICWQCHGDGVIYDCLEEWACVDPESGCDLCERRCDVCRPRKPNPELQQVLSDALADAASPCSMGRRLRRSRCLLRRCARPARAMPEGNTMSEEREEAIKRALHRRLGDN